MAKKPSTDNQLVHAADALAEAARDFAARGWTPATSSNFSMRLDQHTAAITVSGRDKGRLGRDDFIRVDFDGNAIDSNHRPSAETLLHTQLYRRFDAVGVVLHTHSLTQTVASKLFEREGLVELAGYELLKAFPGYITHDAVMRVPVYPNSQDMQQLASNVDAFFDAGLDFHAYLISGHGLYTWGPDMASTRRHLEAIEFMLACELELTRYTR